MNKDWRVRVREYHRQLSGVLSLFQRLFFSGLNIRINRLFPGKFNLAGYDVDNEAIFDLIKSVTVDVGEFRYRPMEQGLRYDIKLESSPTGNFDLQVVFTSPFEETTQLMDSRGVRLPIQGKYILTFAGWSHSEYSEDRFSLSMFIRRLDALVRMLEDEQHRENLGDVDYYVASLPENNRKPWLEIRAD